MLLSYIFLRMDEKIMSTSSVVLSVRVSPEEKAMLQAAAEHSRSAVSDFMRRKSLEAAELEMMDRRVVTLTAAAWDAFEARLAEPACAIPAVAELFSRTPAWSK
jgi:uncharacterized protein (DUF1778 family)